MSTTIEAWPDAAGSLVEEPVDGPGTMPLCGQSLPEHEAKADEVTTSVIDEEFSFPPPPPKFEGGGVSCQGTLGLPMGLGKEVECSSFEGQRIDRLGSLILQRLMEVAPLRSKTMGRGETAFFPLPTSISVLRSLWPTCQSEVIDWVTCVCVGLNTFWGDCIVSDSGVSPSQRGCLDLIRSEVERFCALDISVQGVDWQAFFSIKGIDYKGDEVRVARWIKWENIAPALPREIGRVPLVEVCTH